MQYMDLSLLLYIGMLALGVFVGSRKVVRSRPCRWLGPLQSVALIALIAALGVEIGADDQVIASLGEIGSPRFLLSLLPGAGLTALSLALWLYGRRRRGG